jgi:First Longin domain of INTU, CCZ1 and HPS4
LKFAFSRLTRATEAPSGETKQCSLCKRVLCPPERPQPSPSPSPHWSASPLENAMSLPAEQAPKVVPAQLGFLAIYNPSLGTTDETIENQIVYYSSSDLPHRSRQRALQKPDDDALREEHNEQLRQIGLAQGMVEFGRSFSDGRAVDTVETEKSRIVLHELEAGWWILAVSDTVSQE